MSALGIGDVRIAIAVCDRISCAGCGFTRGNHDQLTMVADSPDGETRGFRRRDLWTPHGLVLGKAWQPNRIYGGTRSTSIQPVGTRA